MDVTISLMDDSSPARFRMNPSATKRMSINSGVTEMEGREFPVGWAGEGTRIAYDLEFLDTAEVEGESQADILETLYDTYRGERLKMTPLDPMHGAAITVWLMPISREMMKSPRSRVAFVVERVDPGDESS